MEIDEGLCARFHCFKPVDKKELSKKKSAGPQLRRSATPYIK